MIKKTGYFIAFLIYSYGVHAQSSSGSAYNAFGLGTFQEIGLESSESKANAGIGARYIREVNLKNPAAINSILGPSHIFDFGINISSLRQQTQYDRASMLLGGLSNLNLWLKVGKSTAMSIGISSFSDSRYDITDNFRADQLLGTYSSRFLGTGGLNRTYIVGSQKITKNLSVGVRGSLVSGKTSSTQLLYNNELVQNIELYKEKSLVGFIADFGIQYSFLFGENKQLTLGSIYQPKYRVTTQTSQNIIFSETDSLTEDTEGYFYFPQKYGVGLSFQGKSLTLNFDMEVEEWSVNGIGENFSYKDQLKGALGFEYVKNLAGDTYLDRLIYRGGISLNNHYLNLKNGNLIGFSGSFGLGFPVTRGTSVINIGYSYNKLNPGFDEGISELTHKIMLDISIGDLWFKSFKYD